MPWSGPSQARIYDYFLGGKDNYEADRQLADQLVELAPDIPALARANRDFLIHAVQAMAEAGIAQFLDLGTGIPTSPNVHEVAARINRQARVVYVDNDPIVMAHARALLQTSPQVAAVQADLRQPDHLLSHPDVTRLVDFSKPLGVLVVSVLHFVDVDDAAKAMAAYRQALVSGSRLALSVGTDEGGDPDLMGKIRAVYTAGSEIPVVARTRPQIRALFGDLTLLPPGLVDVTSWQPPTAPTSLRSLAAIAAVP